MLDSGGVALGLLQVEKPQTFVQGKGAWSIEACGTSGLRAVKGALRTSFNSHAFAGKGYGRMVGPTIATNPRDGH